MDSNLYDPLRRDDDVPGTLLFPDTPDFVNVRFRLVRGSGSHGSTIAAYPLASTSEGQRPYTDWVNRLRRANVYRRGVDCLLRIDGRGTTSGLLHYTLRIDGTRDRYALEISPPATDRRRWTSLLRWLSAKQPGR